MAGWLATILAVAVFAANLLLPRGTNPVLRWLGVTALVTAVPFMFLPFVQLPRYGQRAPGRPYYETTRLVDRGVYGIVRHPQYLGYVLLVLGFAMLSQHPVTVLLAVLSAAAFYGQSAGEESELRRRFGKEYDEYRRRVPRFNAVAGLARRLRGAPGRSRP